jgi:hypothetical protein
LFATTQGAWSYNQQQHQQHLTFAAGSSNSAPKQQHFDPEKIAS